MVTKLHGIIAFHQNPYKTRHIQTYVPEKFINDKTPTMLVKELGSLKMEGEEKVKDMN